MGPWRLRSPCWRTDSPPQGPALSVLHQSNWEDWEGGVYKLRVLVSPNESEWHEQEGRDGDGSAEGEPSQGDVVGGFVSKPRGLQSFLPPSTSAAGAGDAAGSGEGETIRSRLKSNWG